jgi:hypothetical protein
MPGRTPIKLSFACGTNTWTNQPAALTEFLGTTVHRVKAELTDADKLRLCARVNVAGSAGSVLGVQYSLDESVWTTLTTVAMSSTGTKVSAWVDVPDEAKTDVFLRLAGQANNSTGDPVIGLVVVEVYTATTFERVGLVEQFVRNVYQLVKNMRENAQGYKDRIAAGQTAASVATVMVADAGQYLIRLGWLTDLFTNAPTLAGRCLGDLGLLTSQATSLRDTLQGVAEHTQTATLTTGAEVNAEADYILANVPNYAKLW